MNEEVTFFIPTLGGGGAEKVLVNLINNMDPSKFDITLLVLFNTGNNKKYLNSNIKYRYIFRRRFKGNIHFLKLFSPTSLANKFIKDEYDVAISYLEGPTTRIISGIQNNNTKKINWVHSKTLKSYLVKSYRNFEELKKCYNNYEYTVFVSETAKDSFIKEIGIGQSKYIVRYNTIETEKIIKKSNDSIKDLKFNTQKTNLITVGKLIEVKGYDRLLKIAKKLIKENYNIHIYILGEGHLENKIKKIIEDNRMDSYVTMLGYKDNPYKYVKQADLFICSSYSEGFSTAVTESVVVGTPVITTRVSGMEEMLGRNNKYGFIVENDSKALYEGIVTLIGNKNLLNYYK